MRQIGTLGDAEAAQAFAECFRNRGIRAEFRSIEAGEVGVWVVDEDQWTAGRAELAAYLENPADERFRSPGPAGEPKAVADPPVLRPSRRGGPVWRRVPVTLTLIAASVLVFLATRGGDSRTATAQALSIAPFEVQGNWISWDGLSDLRSGQVWRAVTPAFLHFGPLHLLFNMMWVWMLGGAIETLRGRLRFAVLVVAAAAASNLAEYFFNFGFDFSAKDGFQADIGRTRLPNFGGMSGVVFALFGFVWMRSRLLRGSGFSMPRDTVVWMLIWLLVCTSGFVGPIANVAHGVGLLVGMAAGAAPRLWRRA